MSYSVIIPNRYDDIITPLIKSLREFAPEAHVLIIADHHDRNYGYGIIRHEMERFQFAVAVNMGIEACPTDDIFLVNDDTILLEPTFEPLLEVADKFPTVGILSPLIRGCVGNPAQRYHELKKHWVQYERIKFVNGAMPVCFPFVLLRRSMISKIGLLDETIAGYGYDDDEYCQRARRMGFDTAITPDVVVQHGNGGRDLTRGSTWSCSFARREKECRSVASS